LRKARRISRKMRRAGTLRKKSWVNTLQKRKEKKEGGGEEKVSAVKTRENKKSRFKNPNHAKL